MLITQTKKRSRNDRFCLAGTSEAHKQKLTRSKLKSDQASKGNCVYRSGSPGYGAKTCKQIKGGNLAQHWAHYKYWVTWVIRIPTNQMMLKLKKRDRKTNEKNQMCWVIFRHFLKCRNNRRLSRGDSKKIEQLMLWINA